jgi:uncharacterized protein involved in outer membrane biogenesis
MNITHPPSPRQRKRRVTPLRVAAGVALLLAAALAAAEFSGWTFLRVPLERTATSALGVPVLIDAPFRARLLWRPSIETARLQVDAGGGLPDQTAPLVAATRLRVAWRWGDMVRWQLGGPLRLAALTLDEADVSLLRNAAGAATWQLGDAKPEDPAKKDEKTALPMIDELRLTQGRVDFQDEVTKSVMKATVRGGESSRPAKGPKDQADAKPAADGYKIALDGRLRALPVHLRIQLSSALGLLQDDSHVDVAPVLFKVDGEVGSATLGWDGSVSSLAGAQRLTGDLQVKGGSLATLGEPVGVTLPTTPPFDLAGHLEHDNGLWRFKVSRANAGRSHLGGEFQFNTRQAPPLLSGRLTGSRLALADLAPAVGAEGPKRPAAGSEGPQRVLPSRQFDLPSLNAMNADVQVAIEELDLNTDALEPLQGLRGHVELRDGALKIQGLHAEVAGGVVTGQTALQTKDTAADWSANLKFAHLEMARWLGSANRPTPASAPTRTGKTSDSENDAGTQSPAKPAKAAAPRAYLTGALNGDLQLTGSGRSTAEILASLDGRIALRLQNGTLSHLVTEALGLDVAQLLGVGVRGDESLPLRCARFDLRVAKGVATPRYAVIDNADSTLRIKGQVDLAKENLALVAAIQPKDFSLVTLRTPLAVTGTFSKPEVKLERGRLAGKLLAAAALSTISGPAGLLAFIDPGEKPSQDPCTESAAQAAASGPETPEPAAPAKPASGPTFEESR